MASKKVTIKEEASRSSDGRIKLLENDTESLKGDVKRFLSIIDSQSQQLARQSKILDELRDERNAKANTRTNTCFMILLLIIALLVVAITYGPDLIPGEDTVLSLNVKATPHNAPFITVGVKTRFTMGDLLACVKGTFTGDTLDLALV